MDEISFSNLLPIIKKLRPQSPENEAFVCDRDTFSKIYHLEKCRQGSEWDTRFVSHIRITGENNEQLDFDELDSHMLGILKKRIRSADVVCHWKTRHFVTLLYNINESEVKKVQERIKYFYYTSCKKLDEIDLYFRHHQVR